MRTVFVSGLDSDQLESVLSQNGFKSERTGEGRFAVPDEQFNDVAGVLARMADESVAEKKKSAVRLSQSIVDQWDGYTRYLGSASDHASVNPETGEPDAVTLARLTLDIASYPSTCVVEVEY